MHSRTVTCPCDGQRASIRWHGGGHRKELDTDPLSSMPGAVGLNKRCKHQHRDGSALHSAGANRSRRVQLSTEVYPSTLAPAGSQTTHRLSMEVLSHKCLQARRGDGRLRILQLTDIHQFPIGTTTWECEGRGRVIDFKEEGYSAERAPALIATLAETVCPDLVIFTGDIIDGRPFGASSSDKRSWRSAFEALIAPLLSANPPIPWTFCPGNHDDDASPWVRSDLLEIFRLPGSLTPEAQSFDQTVTVGFMPTADPSSVRLWIFDSGGNDEETRYGTFHPEAVASYKALAQSQSLASATHECFANGLE